MDRPIGGYFELETCKQGKDYPHSGSFHLNSGRHALEFILRSQDKLPKAIWLPYYTCDSVFQPLNRLGIPYKFYHINSHLELDSPVKLGPDEMIIVNDYFGLKDNYMHSLFWHYKGQVIIDCTQAWYMPEMLGAKQFYSPRKFFGLPDGGVAWTPIQRELPLEQDHSADRCAHLLKRIDFDPSSGYQDFRDVSATISELPLRKMSKLTETLLGNFDHEEVRMIRRDNYEILYEALSDLNQIEAPDWKKFVYHGCPMIYPFVTKDKQLRRRLIDNNIFVAIYWPGISTWTPSGSFEIELSQNLIPLPIDQRYGSEDMNRIIEVIKR